MREVSRWQALNMPPGIDVHDSGSVMDVSPSHPLKASASTLVSVSGIVRDVSPMHEAKQELPT